MLRKSTQIAIGGVCAALSLVFMLFSIILPFSTYALPALSGAALIPIAVEMGLSVGGVCYLAVAILSLILVPDPETSLMFICFLGYYPILKFKLDRIRSKPLKIILKHLLFNAAILLSYQLLIYLFHLSDLIDSFGGSTWVLGFLLAGNLVFILYDAALRNLIFFYCHIFRKRYLRK